MLVCIDSDGCAFDTVFLKHSECLIPATIRHWHLQGMGHAVRRVCEYITQTGPHRGVNRWQALFHTIELLPTYPGVDAAELPDISLLRQWYETDDKPSEATLRRKHTENPHPIYETALKWSEEFDLACAAMVEHLPAFSEAAQTIPLLARHAELHVVTQAPGKAVTAQWEKAGLLRFAAAVHGQEDGPKAEILRKLGEEHATDAATKNGSGSPLMIGDAPGDLKAARLAGWRFYPIFPERENGSWRQLRERYWDEIRSGRYEAETEGLLEQDYLRSFSPLPPWQTTAAALT